MCGELGLDLGTPKQSLDLLNQLKSLYKAKARKSKVDVSKQAHIIMYPEVPTEAMIRNCYDADDTPVASVSSSAGTLECLRKSSNKTKPETALVPTMPAPGMQPPTMPGFAPNAMQQAMAQQAMAFMGMDPMAMMSMAARFFSQGGQQSQQETPGLKIFAGSKGEVSLAASPTPQAMTPQGVTPQAVTPHGSTPGEDSQELMLALPDAGQLVPPEEQATSVQLATQARQAARATGTPATQTPATKAKAKAQAKAKGKAKAKSQAKVEKESAKAKASGATGSSKRKACDDDGDVAPSHKAKPKPDAKAKARAEKMVFTQENPPSVPEPKSGTTWYRKGKIHRNQGGFRVFLNAGDRCDKKVKITDENDCEAEWQKALKMIDDSYDGIPDAD